MNNGRAGTIANNYGAGPQFNNGIFFGDLYNYGPFVGVAELQKMINSLEAHEKNRAGSKRDPYYIKSERYLVATNPTEIQVPRVTMEDWYGDSEPFFTAYIANSSRLPAERVRVRILAPRKPGEKQSRALVFKRSAALQSVNIGLDSALFMPQGTELKLPLGSRSELLAAIDRSDILDYDFIGIGTMPEIPAAIKNAFVAESTITTNDVSSSVGSAFANRTLGIEIRYTTIFDQKITRLFPVNLYFGKDLYKK
ncbi:MAG: hypothetical protein A3I66_11655 [Burkholderiales bacterium RIFCSPLOWO2_02_FULL_57_36]|nr:MAG: hypothetical protein A3I66_11655 [Burkholderiales bacterium RIFCSPLOWO2_02_FULL_57_36]